MREERGLGWLPDEAFRVGSIGGTEHLLSGVTQRGGPSVVHGGWRHQPETRVVMLAVVPGEEPLAEGTGVLDRTEPLRELRAVLQGLELGLGERIVVGDLGARVAPRHAELRQQQRHGLAGHRRATIGVEKQLAWSDALLRASLGDQPLCERGGLPWREHPAGHVSAEDVEYHVEVEVGPLHRTQECEVLGVYLIDFLLILGLSMSILLVVWLISKGTFITLGLAIVLVILLLLF